MLKKCKVGIKLIEDCNAATYWRLVGEVLFESLSDDDKCLLCLRTRCSFDEENVIYYHHEKIYISYYMAHGLDIPEQELKTDAENDNCSKWNDLDRLVNLIQAKIAVSSQKEKIKLLILAPESWSIQKVIKKINITKYMVKKARALKKEHGILAEPKPKSDRALSKAIFDCVINFYCDD